MNCTATTRRTYLLRSTLALLLLLCPASQAALAEASSAAEPARLTAATAAPPSDRISTRPFEHIAIGVTAGTLGAGAEVVTTISRRSNLRVDGNFFNFSHSITQDGVNYSGNLRLRDARASYDFYPFHGGFRLSAGVAMYNQFNVGAVAAVPFGQTFTLNSVEYTSGSNASNAMTGNASLAYPHKVAPTFTFGFGNAIPRTGRHLAFPIEIGAAYTGAPEFNFNNISGIACSSGVCQDVTTFTQFQTDLTAQRNKINHDLVPLRFYPIINAGATYRF